MKKVYCKDCKYHEEVYSLDRTRIWNKCHSPNRVYKDTPLERLDITNPFEKNEKNNCKDYKEKL